jgi:hypothetical protein
VLNPEVCDESQPAEVRVSINIPNIAIVNFTRQVKKVIMDSMQLDDSIFNISSWFLKSSNYTLDIIINRQISHFDNQNLEIVFLSIPVRYVK